MQPKEKALYLRDRGKEYLQKGSYELAKAKLLEAAKMSEYKVGLRSLYELYKTIGEYEKALAMAQKMIQREKSKLMGKILQSEIFMKLGQFQKAKEGLLEAYYLDRKNIAVLTNLGFYYLMVGKKNKYIRYFGKVFDIYNDESNRKYTSEELCYIAKACRVYVMKSDEVDDRSETLNTILQYILNDAIKKDKYNFEAYIESADILLEGFNLAEAKKTEKEAMKLNSQNPEILFIQAKRLSKRYYLRPKVIPTLLSVLRTNPRHIDALNLKVSIHLADEEYSKAEKALNMAQKINPHHLTTKALQASYYRMQGRIAAYRKVHQEALKINPHCGEFYHIVAQMLSHKRKFEEAIELNKKAIELDPYLWQAYITLGTHLMHVGKIKEAEKTF